MTEPEQKPTKKEAQTAEIAERLAELDVAALVNALAITIWKLESLETRLRQIGSRLHQLEQDLTEEEA